jgi:hypothetical protein
MCQNQSFPEERQLRNLVFFFSFMGDGGAGGNVQMCDFQIFTHYPRHLPVWRGERVKGVKLCQYPEMLPGTSEAAWLCAQPGLQLNIVPNNVRLKIFDSHLAAQTVNLTA